MLGHTAWVEMERQGGVARKRGQCLAVRRRKEGREKPNRARRRKPDTAKANLKPSSSITPEGRVSIARWNPKGMRRSTGPQSMGAAPKMNRSAKGGARSRLHYGGESVLIHPPHQGG